MENELMHYGILGMKWGVRRFQNKDGSLTTSGKARYKTGDGTRKETDSEEREQHKQQKEQEKNAKKAAKEIEEYLKNRNKALTTDDPAEIAKYSKYLSDDELQARINRTRKERELTDLYSQQIGTKYFDGKKAVGQAAMTGFTGIGQGLQALAKDATYYLGKSFIKSVDPDVAKEMFPKKQEQKDTKGGT